MLSLKTKGKLYSNFTQIQVQKSLSTFTSQFSISCTNSDAAFPLEVGSLVEILVDNKYTILTGYISSISINYSSDSHTIVLSGYSVLQDLVNSTIPYETTYYGPISAVQLIRRCLALVNLSTIEIIDKTTGVNLDAFEDDDILTPGNGDSIYTFLSSVLKKRQVFLKTGNSGEIILLSGYQGEFNNRLINIIGDTKNNNILSSQYSRNNNSLFNSYTAYLSDNTSTGYTNESDPDPTNKKKDAIDSSIRNSRRLDFTVETGLEDTKLKDRALWEMNIRKSNSEQYSCTIPGHTLYGENLDTNYLVSIKDDYCGVDKKMLIKDITYNYSVENGSITSLSFVNKESFTLFEYEEDERSSKTDNKSNTKISSNIDKVGE